MTICKNPDCTKSASFNYEGEIKGIYCKIHALENMINVKDKRCKEDGCNTIPSYNYEGETKAIYCKIHALENMIDVKHKRCQQIGCNTIPTYNYEGETKGIYCKPHALENMIDVINKRCQQTECNIRPIYGIPGNKPNYCTSHKGDGMIKKPTQRCENKKCTEIAIYGYKCAIYCENHMINDMINLIEHECSCCGLTNILNEEHICTYCDPKHFNAFRGAKEREVKMWLTVNNYNIIQHDRMIDKGTCIKNRPDFLLESPNKTHYVVLEVDEDQHYNYEEDCECTRMVNISQALGMPTIFIRYNPDEYKVNKRKRNPTHNTRMKVLKKFLNWTLNKTFDEISDIGFCSMVQLYYDNWSEETTMYETILEFDEDNDVKVSEG